MKCIQDPIEVRLSSKVCLESTDEPEKCDLAIDIWTTIWLKLNYTHSPFNIDTITGWMGEVSDSLHKGHSEKAKQY